MEQLHQFTQDIIITVKKVFRTVMFGFEPPINLENIRDRMNNSSPNFSFLSDPGNKLKHKYIDFLQYCHQNIRPDITDPHQFTDQTGYFNSNFKPATPIKATTDKVLFWARRSENLTKWLSLVEHALRLLYVNMHMHCGQPTRAPQIGSMIWRNTAEGELRNIMVIFGQMIIFTKNMKHVALNDTPWISAHFLPPRLA